MSAHLNKAQCEAQGPLGELSLIHMGGISLAPYHSEPNPKVGAMAKGTTLERLLNGWLNVDQ